MSCQVQAVGRVVDERTSRLDVAEAARARLEIPVLFEPPSESVSSVAFAERPVPGFEQALEDVAILVEGKLNDAWSDRRIVWMVRVGEAVYDDALDRCDTYRLGHEQKHVRVCDVYESRPCGKVSKLVVLRNLATQVLRAVLMQRQSRDLTCEPRPVLEHDGEVGGECAVPVAGDAREALEVVDRAGYLRSERDVVNAISKAETTSTARS